MTVRTRYRGRQAWMAGTSADRDKHSAITADVPNQNLMPYCRYRFSLHMLVTVPQQQPGVQGINHTSKPAPAALLACVLCCTVSRMVQHWLEAFWRVLLPGSRVGRQICCEKQQVCTHCAELAC